MSVLYLPITAAGLLSSFYGLITKIKRIMENMDKSKMYISPSKESIMAYVDGEWKQFLRSDVIQELQVKTCNKPAVSKCEDVEREPAVCLHNYVYYGECDENIIHRCVKCGNLK